MNESKFCVSKGVECNLYVFFQLKLFMCILIQKIIKFSSYSLFIFVKDLSYVEDIYYVKYIFWNVYNIVYN